MGKYRRSINRHSKKKIPPGRKGKHANTPSSNIEEENQATTTMTDNHNDSTTTATDEIIFNSTCAKN